MLFHCFHCYIFITLVYFQATATQTDRSDFLSEAAILGQFSDPNVIFLQGVILKGFV